ncbi:F0F1 ATP synthase subunit delta [Nocardioides dilutus]
MLRGASAEALAELTKQAGTSGTLADQATLGQQLFGVVEVLRGDAALRRALTDNSVEGDSKAGLAKAVFGSAVSDATATLVADAASRRWTGGRDLADVLERLAVIVTVRSAGAKGQQVGDELFAVRQMLDANPELRGTLSDLGRSAKDRSALVTGLVSGELEPATETLVVQAISRGQGSVDKALEEFLDVAAEALGETVATVHTARELSDADQQRLAGALSKQYSTTVQLHVVLDPTLLGGLRVAIGDDVIDGSVSNRLDDARRRIAG